MYTHVHIYTYVCYVDKLCNNLTNYIMILNKARKTLKTIAPYLSITLIAVKVGCHPNTVYNYIKNPKKDDTFLKIYTEGTKQFRRTLEAMKRIDNDIVDPENLQNALKVESIITKMSAQ